jgi:hypothetical protein
MELAGDDGIIVLDAALRLAAAGWLRLVFSSLLLDVILNQNPITINSTNFCSYWR